MQNIAAGFHTIPNAGRSQARSIGIGFVVLLHVGLIYALATGLAVKFAKYIPPVLEAHIVEPPKQPPPPAVPPPPSAALLKPPPIATVPPPEIKIAAPQTPPPIQTVVGPPQPPPTPQPVQQAPAQPAVPDSGPSGIMSTHTIPPYPPVARRLTHEGTVLLQISVSAQGDITDVQVAQSSGFSELDQTAEEWVKSHWRYHPAIKGGQPVAGTVQASVKFNLQEAH